MSEPRGFYWSDLNDRQITECVPFMVDCPNCVCDTANYCDHCSDGDAELDGCDGFAQVRNPALEWRWSCHWWSAADDLCIPDFPTIRPTCGPDCKWVAVGVKEVSE